MNLAYYISRLEQQAMAIAQLAENVGTGQAHWKPSADEWSMLQVIEHLLDEERQDFRLLLHKLLSGSDAAWPVSEPIDAEGEEESEADTEAEADEQESTLGSSLQSFLDERADSLEWLNGLVAPNWEDAMLTPQSQKFSSLQAGDILTSWVAHDLLHLRQLIELHFAYQSQLAQPNYSVAYAGDW
jgi:hypothetical protein